ncbi:MAG: CRISPR-associated protein Csx11 [Paludibacteraceae bacterium]|nr:CRISPR-associated protein Csx11 [Paludibacteraceae bacterium]
MNNLIENIKNKRDNILLGEIGALLHDIGKCDPNFVEKQSAERIKGLPHHAREIDKLLNPELINVFKKVKIKFNNEEKSVYDLIRYHHDVAGTLLTYLEKCDRLDSADDKGVVRRKQPKDSTIITSPFGFPKEKIDLQCLKKRLDDLQNNLKVLFQNYTTRSTDITCFRSSIVTNVKTTFSHALGETRIPANDVTLWDHSHSTASLFKSVLCSMALDETLNPDKLQWRIFGFCWDGIGFINKGNKIADIISRSRIIEEIKNKLQNEFENEIPIGNVIYEDINGIYFTFPALSNDSKKLAKECIEIGLKIIRDTSNDELWPFFTLSKASRTLTILSKELQFADEKRNIPKMTPALFIEEQKQIFFDNPEMPESKNGEDICPVCRLRSKPEDDERCQVCEGRKRNRLSKWFDNRENTIWLDEVADTNNRIALLTFSFDLDRWLDGTMVKTLFSQTFEDWKNSKKWQAIQNNLVQANKDCVYKVLEKILSIKDSDKDKDKDKAAKLLNTFFEDVKINNSNLSHYLSNIKEKIETNQLNKENLATYLFTQNPSPARLYRIWTETKEFFELFINAIKKNNIYSNKWKRLHFFIDNASKDKIDLKNLEYAPLIIKIEGLNPESILAMHTSNGEFYTIESLEKYKFQNKSGVEAAKEALNKEIEFISEEDNSEDNLIENNQNLKINNPALEEYYPFIELTKSPLSLRLIVPAADSAKIMNSVIKLCNDRFEKVLGKLPLNMSLLVANRKFPLYVLLEAGGRMLRNKEFKDPELMDAWWDINGLRTDNYYNYYPLIKKDSYNLDDLSTLSKGKSFALYPGYFDFDLLLGTNDRFNIIYNNKKRAGNDYKLYSQRPYYLYQYSEMVDLWEILNNNISSSQINFIEEMLTNKLREWYNVNDAKKDDTFKKFTEATIKDAFSSKWDQLRTETQDFILNSAYNGLLLDTIFLFKHTI